MPSHFALQHATQAPSQVRIVWRIVWNSLVPSPSPHVREENISGEGSGHETKSGNAWKAVWEWDQTPSAVGVHSRLVLHVLTVLIPLLIWQSVISWSTDVITQFLLTSLLLEWQIAQHTEGPLSTSTSRMIMSTYHYVRQLLIKTKVILWTILKEMITKIDFCCSI